jgi:uncharacterized protein YcfJ
MKKLIALCIIGAAFLTAQAQLLSPQSVHGALWGGLIGGVIGGDRHHGFSRNGAAIGAGVGLLAGSLANNSSSYSYYDEPVSYYSEPRVSFGYGYGRSYGHCGSSAYVYYAPNNYLAPGHYYRATRPNYAVSGTILGATSGALIGAGRHDAGKGAIIGAAAGLALGSVAEHVTRREEQRVVAAQNTSQATVVVSPATSDVRPQTSDSSIASAQITSRPSASSTYTWTPRPQIADAPRVPDAPTY